MTRIFANEPKHLDLFINLWYDNAINCLQSEKSIKEVDYAIYIWRVIFSIAYTHADVLLPNAKEAAGRAVAVYSLRQHCNSQPRIHLNRIFQDGEICTLCKQDYIPRTSDDTPVYVYDCIKAFRLDV